MSKRNKLMKPGQMLKILSRNNPLMNAQFNMPRVKIGSTLRIRLPNDYTVAPGPALHVYEEPVTPPLMNAWDRFHLEGTVPFPTIFKHTEAQLDAAVERAAKLPEFWVLLHGIDAYMERRRRRVKAARGRAKAKLDQTWQRANPQHPRYTFDVLDNADNLWGDQ